MEVSASEQIHWSSEEQCEWAGFGCAPWGKVGYGEEEECPEYRVQKGQDVIPIVRGGRTREPAEGWRTSG